MVENKTVFIVDAGNTRIKLGVFSEGKLTAIHHFNWDENELFTELIHLHHQPPVFVSSVLSEPVLASFLFGIPQVQIFHSEMKLPVTMGYASPETLGLDRLANACAIQGKQKEGNKVAIDLGTCIKFDVVNDQGVYIGGSISPGLRMRFEALHHFTGKLPLLEPEKMDSFVGNDSFGSIQAGVIEGIQGELNHFISRYLQDYQGLTFFVTGGDAKFFEFPAKNNIFADENLTLTGLYEIYLLNA